MSKKLLIVESPAKAKTIEKYLGSEFVVSSSYGHIRDLPKSNAIDIANDFLPRYEIPKEKEKVVKELIKLKKSATEVYLATDEDREGEAISWHLCQVLGLDERTTKRVTYTEITEKAIKAAISKPRLINMNLVMAQQSRRILDRLVGFEISPILWKKVRPSLSAGRVQSVAVRLIVDREREIQDFESKASFKIQGFFKVKDLQDKLVSFRADCPREFKLSSEANQILEAMVGAKFKVKSLEKKAGKKSPTAPFTTSSLQQESAKKFGYSVSKTMIIAQRLYEAGHITYMRTDSVNLSNDALADAQKNILKLFGHDFHQKRTYKSKTSNAQEAHEAIRPTDFSIKEIQGTSEEQRLYELIWKRAIASQMSDAQTENTIITIENDKSDTNFVSKQEIIVFEGFLKAYVQEIDEDEEENQNLLLPKMSEGQILDLDKITATEKFSKNPPRYNEASLVKKLEELGIGRPSTYAPTISTIQNREYVLKDTRDGKLTDYEVITLKKDKVSKEKLTMTIGAEKNKLFPTDIGIVVTDFLMMHFPEIVDYQFTAKVENEFDEISKGSLDWHKMLEDFYTPFKATVTKTENEAERESGERILGEDSISGEVVLVRIGRFGPMAQIGRTNPDNPDFKPKYAKLRKDQSLATITMEEVLDLFKLPRVSGQFENSDMKVAVGRFGPYIQHSGAFYSIPKGIDPMEIDEQACIQIIEEKREKDRNKTIADFGEIQILIGRWGPYIKSGKENYKIPKDQDAAKLTQKDCEALIKEQDTKPKSAKKTKFTRRKS
ncbi:MAG: type I DNA topoisomerase [Chitinophagales bacterium]|jgi:DNA topoisomerase-1|nr:type I DNA topoisomerase [Chitinophagales bacterium]